MNHCSVGIHLHSSYRRLVILHVRILYWILEHHLQQFFHKPILKFTYLTCASSCSEQESEWAGKIEPFEDVIQKMKCQSHDDQNMIVIFTFSNVIDNPSHVYRFHEDWCRDLCPEDWNPQILKTWWLHIWNNYLYVTCLQFETITCLVWCVHGN